MTRRRVQRRLGTLAAALLALAAVPAAPALAGTGPAACSWTFEKIAPPDGYAPQDVRVTGTDSHGDYSGTVPNFATDSARMVIWTGGVPRIVPEIDDFLFPQIVGENSAGTVLLSGTQRSTSRSGVFLYSAAGALTYLTAPAGYRTDYAVALNKRGDVLASGSSIKDGHAVTLLWSTLAAAPRVIDTAVGQGIDLDDDGTVLLSDGKNGPGHLWQGGRIVPLGGPGYPLLLAGIRGGHVIGTEIGAWPESQSVVWHAPGDARPIDDGGTAQAINAHGLIAGSRDTLTGPPAVWSDTTHLADLPLPAGFTDDSDMYVIGDDNTIFGSVNGYGPIRWTCTPTHA
ncbi:MAG TPA: hypothetical protein VGH57_35070 [Amycolatopsis sp.]|jgi:hypothetical protein